MSPLSCSRISRAQESLSRRSSLVICLLFSMLVSCISGLVLFFWLKYMLVQKNHKINIKKRSAHKMQVLNLPPFPQVTTGNRLMSLSPVLSMWQHRPFVPWTGITLFVATTGFSPSSVRRHRLPAHAHLPDVCTSRLHILIVHVLMSSRSFPACVGSSFSLTQGSALEHTELVIGVHKPVFKN